MIDKEFEELYDPETWDDESAEVHIPTRRPRAIISVPFSLDEIERIDTVACERGVRASALIREAVLGRVGYLQATTSTQSSEQVSRSLTPSTFTSGSMTQATSESELSTAT